MEYRIDQKKLRSIIQGPENVYSRMITILVEQYLGITKSNMEVPIPGGGTQSGISAHGFQFLIDAKVLVENSN